MRRLDDIQPIGPNHPKVKQVRAVQKNTKSNRRNLFVAEGLWAAKLLLASSCQIDTVFWCPEAVRSTEAEARARELVARASDAYRVSSKTLERLSERDRSDGILVLAASKIWRPDEVDLRPDSLVMVADGMNIPGNLGTLIRTLDAARADCLVLTNRQTRITHPMVFRSSQGMVISMPIIDFDTDTDAIEWLRAEEFDVMLASTGDAMNYRSPTYFARRTAFVVGSERHGLSTSWRTQPFQHVEIPMLGQADSLNVSISAAVLLFEARAQKERW